MSHLRPSPHNRQGSPRRYGLSVLAIFRNEACIIEEWVKHYLMFGVEHFYLINNNSTDRYLEQVLPYVLEGVIDLFDCEKDGFQIGAYTELLPKLVAETEWVGIFDLDEFIYPTSGGQITDVLARFSAYESILIPWLSFGSGGRLEQPASVIDGFVRRGDAALGRAMLKAISRPADIIRISQHNPATKSGSKVLANGAEFGDEHFIRLDETAVCSFALVNNHYRLQSRDHFRQVKAGRPEVNEKVADSAKTMAFFWENDPLWNGVPDRRLADMRIARQGVVRHDPSRQV